MVRICRAVVAVLGLVFWVHITCLRGAAADEVNTKLAFSAIPVKAKYTKAEKALITLRLRNQGTSSVLLAPLSTLDEYVRLRVIGPDGKEVSRCGNKVDGGGLAGQKFMIVPPNRSLRAVINLTCDERAGDGYNLAQTGEYTIFAEYGIGLSKKALSEIARGAKVWNGRIEAPAAKFLIISSNKNEGTNFQLGKQD